MGQNDRQEQGKRKAKQKEAVETFDAEFAGFINLQVSDEQKDAFERWADSSSPWEALEAFTADGVAISVKWDARSAAFMGSATQRRVSSPNAGLVVTARGGTATKALFRTIFCLTILSHAEKWTDLQPVANPDRW